jgi:hypothetical protein
MRVGLLVMKWQSLLQPQEGFNVHLFQDSMISARQVAIALKEVKQWKYETMEDYYDKFLQLCVIPQQQNDVYLRETFGEGLRKKLKQAITGMCEATIT